MPLPREKRAPILFVALVWLLGICMCLFNVMQNWMHDETRAMQIIRSSSRPWMQKQAEEEEAEAHRTLWVCLNEVKRHHDFAIVVASAGGQPQHVVMMDGAVALGKSIKAWGLKVDLLFLGTDPTHPQQAMWNEYGAGQGEEWTLCLVEPSALLLDLRLKAWGLVEYKAVVVMELDTLVVGDASVLFDTHYVRMKEQNISLGALTHQQSPCKGQQTKFSTGVLLVIPSFMEYLRIRKQAVWLQRAKTKDALLSLADVLHARYDHTRVHALPAELNANIAWKHCNHQWWTHAEIRILHFTVAKPWGYRDNVFSAAWNAGHPWACWLTATEELCALWKQGFESKRLDAMSFCWWVLAYNKNTCHNKLM
jgi:hypothetical protein